MIEVSFHINYWTKFGENLALVGNVHQLGEWNPNNAKKLSYRGDGNWGLELQFDPSAIQTLQYRYIVIRGDGSVIYEKGSMRIFDLQQYKTVPSVLINDIWKSPAGTEEVSPHLRSAIFSDVIFGRHKKSQPQTPQISKHSHDQDTVLVKMQLYSIFVPPTSSIRVVGSCSALGNWDIKTAPVMNDANAPFWEVEVVVKKSEIPFEYKFAIADEHGGKAIWEEGSNRHFWFKEKNAVIVDGGKFNRNYQFRGSGVSIPVFSIRTKNGLGVGEFLDIKLLVDWAVKCGFKIIQILPINDTNARLDWRDSYPYSSISVFALHPIYVHLPSITTDKTLLAEIENQQQKFNNLPSLDYEAVLAYKYDIMKRVYKQTGETMFASEPFKQWFKTNEHWLAPYALFCVLRDKYHTSDYSTWPEYSKITREEVHNLTSPKSPLFNEVSFYLFIQYHLHLQLKEAADYAMTHQVGIKGDIAIGVNRNSCDTWIAPNLYRMNKSTGAPPDAFSADGQNWGFPTYNWDEMAKDDYAWWRARLTHMSQYCHAFRIDHILGFFRIWEIPGSSITAILGRFNPALPIWRSELERLGFWDTDRLSKPYVRPHLLERYFSNYDTIDQFFDRISATLFRFKAEYSTEKQIAAAIPSKLVVPHNAREEDIKKINFHNAQIDSDKAHLFLLLQNVILLQDPDDPNKFYPRIEMMKTPSYAELGTWQKDVLKNLYIDYYYHRQESLWAATALQRLPVMINSTKMLCCGEDLGMVPACVPPVMDTLNILGLRIQRMPGDPKTEFTHPSDYPYMTVCTPSVHDTSTLRGWWQEDRGAIQRFWSHILGEPGPAPYFCDEHVTTKVINQHIYSPSMWAIFMMQDLFGLKRRYFENRDPEQERINVPSNPEHYWRYRMHVTVEDLIHDDDFCQTIHEMLRHSGRTWPEK